jgi:hypothetical protein
VGPVLRGTFCILIPVAKRDFSKELVKFIGGELRKIFLHFSIYTVLPWCTVTSYNTAHAYSKDNASKTARNMLQRAKTNASTQAVVNSPRLANVILVSHLLLP